MRQLIFEGYLDYAFGELVVGMEEYNNGTGRPIVFQVRGGDEGLLIYGLYSSLGDADKWGAACWIIGIKPIAEGHPMPEWPMRMQLANNGYSPRLVIDAPDDVEVTCLSRESKS